MKVRFLCVSEGVGERDWGEGGLKVAADADFIPFGPVG